jgi:malonyl-CoA O-methyltransferase
VSQGRFLLDTAAVRRRFSRAAQGYDQAAVLQREVARRMAERLDLVRLDPVRVVDLGCGTGSDLNLLGERYPRAQRVGYDSTLPMLRHSNTRGAWFGRLLPRMTARSLHLVCGDATALALKPDCASLIWSNLMLHWLNEPMAALREMHRVLETGGLLMFTTLGPDTLKELRAAFAAADARPHVHEFVDMHDLGDMLSAAGFDAPVMDMELVKLTYPDTMQLLRELQQSGTTNAAAGRHRGLTGARGWQRALAVCDATRIEGRLAATFEVIYGHAWKPERRVAADGRAVVRFVAPRNRSQ